VLSRPKFLILVFSAKDICKKLILYTVVVHDCVKTATTEIKRVTNMALKTGKNGYRKSGVRKDTDTRIYMKSSFKPLLLNAAAV